MKIAKVCYQNKIYWGIVNREGVNLLNSAPYAGIKPIDKKIPIESCRVLAPADPTKIILAGLNYKNHAAEMKMKIPQTPIIFLKPPSALIGHNEKIIYPRGVQRLDYEAELALVIKRQAKNILTRDAGKYILGFSCLNDITARDLQKKDRQWTRAKSFDSFCPLGPYLETSISVSNLKIRSYLNGKLKQDSTTREFIFSVQYLVAFISRIMTLLPGDIISTGTPPGVGRMNRGDKIEIEIEGIGRLENQVV